MRLAVVALGPRVTWTTPPEKFLHVCGYTLNEGFTMRKFFSATEEELRHELVQLRRQRCVEKPLDDPGFWCWEDILLPSQKTRFKHYCEDRLSMMRCGKLLGSDDVIVDLDQNPAAGRGKVSTDASQSFCTLITHGCLWHIQLARPLISVEACRVHCWLVGDWEMSSTPHVVDMWKCLQDDVVTCKQMFAFQGDGLHLRVFGSWIMWMFANVGCRDAPLIVQPSLSPDSEDPGELPAKKKPRWFYVSVRIHCGITYHSGIAQAGFALSARLRFFFVVASYQWEP